MHIKRDKAFFDGSRLYRQSGEGSRAILEMLLADQEPFLKPIHLLRNGKEKLTIENLEDCRKYISASRDILSSTCSSIYAYLAIPILAQTISDYYYGINRLKPHWAGTAIKTALAHIWSNIYGAQAASDKSISTVVEAIKIAAFHEQLAYNMTDTCSIGHIAL